MKQIHSLLLALIVLLSGSVVANASLSDAESLLEQGKLEQAMAEVDAILEVRPEDPETRFLKGIILAEQGREDDAIEVFAALTQDYPELPEPYNNLAVLFAQQGNYEKARDALRAAIRTHPSYSTAHENLGDLYAKMASHSYDRALEENSRNESARLKLSQISGLFRMPESESIMAAVKPAPVTETVNPIPEPEIVVSEPVSEPTEPPPEDGESIILAAISSWSAAWSAQDVNAYLSHYASSFRPKGGMARESWAAQRRERLGKPNFIEVKIENPTVQMKDEKSARVEFLQLYRADSYNDRVVKILDMTREGNEWQIQREQSKAP